MLSINTNLSSLIAQNSLTTSTNKLNQAIERMTTGFKINRAKDNAANYNISSNMTTQINSLDVAEDNLSQGLDLINTSDQLLSEINDRVTRLRNLQEQALNGTYGEESLKAINSEVNALVDEVQRLYQTAEYNGIKLFMETQEDASGNHYYEQESFADEKTTFEQLEIASSSFTVYSKEGVEIQTYDVEATNTIGDFLLTLRNEGFQASIDKGLISIKSNDGKYIIGDLANELGIYTTEQSYVASTEQSFNNQVPVTTESTTIITEYTTTTTSTTNTTTLFETTTVETTTTRTEQTTTVTSTETLITDYTTTTTSTTSTSTIYTTATIETTTTTTTETIATVYTATTETLKVDTTLIETITPEETITIYTATTPTLMVPATAAATYAMRSGASPAAETGGFIQEVTRRDTSTMTALSSMASNAELASGTYKISTTEELEKLATLTNAGYLPLSKTYEFVLADNIDLSSISNWTPIGSFRGSFDGNGYIISNLTINRPDEDYVGLFAEGYIKNLGIENIYVKGNNYVGALGGSCNAENCYVSNGYVYGNYYVGGLLGESSDVNHCYSSVSVTGLHNVGGLAGYGNGLVEFCYSIGDVFGEENTAGFIGYSTDYLYNCYSTGNVQGQAGFVCSYEALEIINCFSTGNVTGGSSGASGFIFASGETYDFTNCFSTGSVSGEGSVAGFLFESWALGLSPDFNNCYTTQADNYINVTTKSEILSQENLENMGFTEENGWAIVDGQPALATYTPTGGTPEPPPVTYTTATLDTTLGELGVSYSIIAFNPDMYYEFDASSTMAEVIEAINSDTSIEENAYNAELIDGVLHITSSYNLNLTYSSDDELIRQLNAVETSSTTTAPAVTQTTTVSTTATLDTTLGELGVSDYEIYDIYGFPIIFSPSSTLQGIINILYDDYNIEATLINGVLDITTPGNDRLDVSQGLLAELGAVKTSSTSTTTVTTTQTIQVEQVTETPVTETIWTTTTAETTRTETITTTQTIDVTVTETILTEQVTETLVTETIWHTTTSETTRTETIYSTDTVNATGTTLFDELGVENPMKVTIISNGTKDYVTIRGDTTLDEFYTELLTYGITASDSGGITTFVGDGNSYIASDNLTDLLGLSVVDKIMGTKTTNTDSERQYSKERIYGVYAPGQVTLQAGIGSGEHSQIEVDVAFSLRGINNLRGIGEDLTTDYLTILDEMLTEITQKQTQFGAASNRLESALEEISIRRENLVSSRSTIRDANIAEVSSEYICMQILQQASAILMSTANQSPSIALQLI